MKTIKRNAALSIGGASIVLALCVQLFNDVSCYEKEIFEAVINIWFPAIPLIPAFFAMASSNPLKAVGASIVTTMFYVFAYYTDCVRPYEGGGASMVYVVVIMYGLPLSILASAVVGAYCRGAEIVIEER